MVDWCGPNRWDPCILGVYQVSGLATQQQAGLATQQQAGLATQWQAGLATQQQAGPATQQQPSGYLDLQHSGNVKNMMKEGRRGGPAWVWGSDCDYRTIWFYNETRGASDHNLIGIDISTKDIQIGCKNILRYPGKNFNKERCLQKFRHIDWSSILQETNVNIANSQFADLVNEVLEIGDAADCNPG